jgi:hypothetical protein
MELDEYHAIMNTPRSKYGNKHVRIDGILFDSQAEGRRYQELKLLVAAGEIRDLQVHPKFPISPAGRDRWTHKAIRARTYEADFQYIEDGHIVAEDIKGARTQLFSLKWDIVRLRFPNVEFRLVKA